MCEIDWNLFNGAVGAIANALVAIVAIIAAVFAFRQVREARNARLTQVALQINLDVQSYRNQSRIRSLRTHLLDLLHQYPDRTARTSALQVDSQLQDIWGFMARMNNLCWTISRLPADENGSWRDSILSMIASNLVAEWDCVEPIVQLRRHERKALGLDNENWYMRHFEAVAAYLRAHYIGAAAGREATSCPPINDKMTPNQPMQLTVRQRRVTPLVSGR